MIINHTIKIALLTLLFISCKKEKITIIPTKPIEKSKPIKVLEIINQDTLIKIPKTIKKKLKKRKKPLSYYYKFPLLLVIDKSMGASYSLKYNEKTHQLNETQVMHSHAIKDIDTTRGVYIIKIPDDRFNKEYIKYLNEEVQRKIKKHHTKGLKTYYVK